MTTRKAVRARITLAVAIAASLGLAFSATESRAAEKPYAFPTRDSTIESRMTPESHLRLKVGFVSGTNPATMNGFAASAGWQGRVVGADLRVSRVGARYGAISVSPDPTDYTYETAAEDPGSEISRARSDQDPWRYLLIEPGVSAAGRLFVNWLPLLSQRARFGLGTGWFQDDANSLGFSALVFSFEGALRYQLGTHSPWQLETAVSYNVGRIVESRIGGQTGRLPVSWLTSSISLVYCLPF